MTNCNCQDWQKISKEHPQLFKRDQIYGHVITWIELTKEKNFHKTNHYGIAIAYCPFCGGSLANET